MHLASEANADDILSGQPSLRESLLDASLIPAPQSAGSCSDHKGRGVDKGYSVVAVATATPISATMSALAPVACLYQSLEHGPSVSSRRIHLRLFATMITQDARL